ncbi:MAG: VOC family protein [Rhodospirillaceae bacterium]|nr:VOC family protein [Rhodospirillaceae bacterium]
MLHHISLGVTDLARAVTFYDTALAPLGYVRVWSDMRPGEDDQAVGYGVPGGDDKLALKQVSAAVPATGSLAPGAGYHFAFAAPSRAAIDAFYHAALSHGGIDNGPPGPRPHYGDHYYAAFVIDPDGNRIEAVMNSAM